MKSTTRSPPRSRSRICRATSGTASRFVAKTVSSRSSLPVKRPVLTSMATSASVWWMTQEPPDGSAMRLDSAASISRSTPKRSKIGSSSPYVEIRGTSAGATCAANSHRRAAAASSSTRISPKSDATRSRRTRSGRSSSRCSERRRPSVLGLARDLRRERLRYARSASSSASDAPSRRRARDEASLARKPLQDLPQALALGLVGDAARDADLARRKAARRACARAARRPP